jgi:hypothetical protein
MVDAINRVRNIGCKERKEGRRAWCGDVRTRHERRLFFNDNGNLLNMRAELGYYKLLS